MKETGQKLIAQNKKGRHDYFIDEVIEAGLVLVGTEVKSLRAGRATLTDGYAMVKEGELWLCGVHIPEYNEGTWTNHSPRRERKLLMHKREVSRLIGTLKESGQTLIPLSLYFKDGKVKVEMGLARGKKAHDKRASLLERQASREIDRELARRSRGRDD
ncbi:MAG: SsrA-binding protein SmpB [Actinobacteria bacterium]|nr:SsrA-binding protein SmpB [Actinomycetota bacterium]NDB31499.1 SsrA-binding protein SmpB [Actinomycetota bacterium]NDF42470.1 SsrA-binding protein SmpB [Actinomycetota bacterium]